MKLYWRKCEGIEYYKHYAVIAKDEISAQIFLKNKLYDDWKLKEGYCSTVYTEFRDKEINEEFNRIINGEIECGNTKWVHMVFDIWNLGPLDL